MSNATRRWMDFGAGVLIAAAVVAGAWHFYPALVQAPASQAIEAAMERREALRSAADGASTKPVARGASAAADPRLAVHTCGFDPVLAASSPQDGQFMATTPLLLDAGRKATPYVVVAREASRQQRQRDAEVALIVACRLAALRSSLPTVALGDIQRSLAAHYLAATRRAGSDASASTIAARTREVLAATVATYTAALGPQASKTRLAKQSLADFRPDIPSPWRVAEPEPEPVASEGEAAPAVPARGPGAVTAARVERRQVPARPLAQGEVAARTPPAPSRVRGDPELAQLERDLLRLRAQAEAVSQDAEGIRRRARQSAAQRDAQCRDKACLVDWYARRRKELLAEF